ncbi:MAG: hypothetical protein IT427_19815 [Pirellulales bacterium]|nr:hypothetical protein [Pirellulales bacterium]
MGYLLADSPDGQHKEAEVTQSAPSTQPTHGNLRHGFVYERVPHITLKSIANNAEIDVIWEKWQTRLEPLRQALNEELRQDEQDLQDRQGGTESKGMKGSKNLPAHPVNPVQNKELGLDEQDLQDQQGGIESKGMTDSKNLPAHPVNPVQNKPWEEWEIPRAADPHWPKATQALHAAWWEARIARQKEIDASIAAKAEFEYLYDKPYEDKKKVRVAGPFTVESLSPHRVLGVDENDELIDPLKSTRRAGSVSDRSHVPDFAQIILENLKTAGVQQAHKEDRITFTSLVPWPGEMVCAAGTYRQNAQDKNQAKHPENPVHPVNKNEMRAAIFIGPEFGTVQRQDLVQAAREAGDANFDVLIACAFNYEAHATEFNKLGKLPVLKARMNADLHMAEDLKNTGKGNLFVIFGEPDIEILTGKDGKLRVKVNGVDVFHPNTGEVRSDGADGIACWFLDTDYNEESFFVRHAYFLGASDPYKSLKTTLKAEINADAWSTLHRDTSRPFDKPASGRIAVKVINHLGDEVMKVFRVK